MDGWGEKTATVYNTGYVVWNRQGTLRALATYSGLSAFPFDTLGTQLIFGLWAYPASEVVIFLPSYPSFQSPGVSFGTSKTDSNSLNVYQEYQFVVSKTSTRMINGKLKNGGVNEPDQPSSFTIDIYMSRALSFYITKAVIPQIVLTYLSFGTLLLDVRTGERLSFSATLFLASVAMDITFSEFIPACPEWLWMQTLIFVSLLLSACTIGVSLYVTWLYYLDKGEDEGFDGVQTPLYNVRRVGSWKVWNMFKSNGAIVTGEKMDLDSGDLSMTSSVGIDGVVELPVDSDVMTSSIEDRRSKFKRDKNVQDDKDAAKRRSLHVRSLTFNRHNVLKGERIDFIFFNVLLLLYTLFLVCMFATIPAWRAADGGIEEVIDRKSVV